MWKQGFLVNVNKSESAYDSAPKKTTDMVMLTDIPLQPARSQSQVKETTMYVDAIKVAYKSAQK